MSVGTTLSDARVAAGLSLDDLAAQSKLRASILSAMEAGDFSHCGGLVYARGQLRALAPVLNLDPDALVAAFSLEVEAGLHGTD
ncbi:MAG: helix-turn-helix domain-containing protein [Candidatus Nanopelagicales bacterium]|nr:helix-turn-helix domain-containing protein [Candidatus Nanopelagicales bacterium]